MRDLNPYAPPQQDLAGAPVIAPGPFTVLDWIGVVVTALAVLGTGGLSLKASVFAAMYRDLGAESLPLLTCVILWPGSGVIIALPSAVLVALALWKRRRLSLGHRRALVVLAFALALCGLAIFIVGLYQPIFELAGTIEAQ